MWPSTKRSEQEDITYVYIPQTTAAETPTESNTITSASKRLRIQADGDLPEDFRIQSVESLSYDISEEDDEKLLNIDWNNLPDFSESSKEKLKYEHEIMQLKIQVKELQQTLNKKDLEVLVLRDRNAKLKENLKTAIEKLKVAMQGVTHSVFIPPQTSPPPTMVSMHATRSIQATSSVTQDCSNGQLPQVLSVKSYAPAPPSPEASPSTSDQPQKRTYRKRPTPGVYTPEEAAKNNMVPLVEGMNVYLYPQHLKSIQSKEKPTFVLRKLMRLFFSDEELKRSNFSGKSHYGFSQLNKEVTTAMLEYCSNPINFPEGFVNYHKLTETINNVCAELRTVRRKPYIRKKKTSTPQNTSHAESDVILVESPCNSPGSPSPKDVKTPLNSSIPQDSPCHSPTVQDSKGKINLLRS